MLPEADRNVIIQSIGPIQILLKKNIQNILFHPEGVYQNVMANHPSIKNIHLLVVLEEKSVGYIA